MQLGQAGHPDMRLASFLTISQRPHPALGLDQPRRCTVSLLLWGQNRPLEFPGPRFLWGVCASVLTLRPRSRGQACPARPPGCRPRVGEPPSPLAVRSSLALGCTFPFVGQFPRLSIQFYKTSCGLITGPRGGEAAVRLAVCDFERSE